MAKEKIGSTSTGLSPVRLSKRLCILYGPELIGMQEKKTTLFSQDSSVNLFTGKWKAPNAEKCYTDGFCSLYFTITKMMYRKILLSINIFPHKILMYFAVFGELSRLTVFRLYAQVINAYIQACFIAQDAC